jgi:hypothetical protein
MPGESLHFRHGTFFILDLKGTKQSGTGIANHSEKAKTVFAFENKYFRFVYHISPGD